VRDELAWFLELDAYLDAWAIPAAPYVPVQETAVFNKSERGARLNAGGPDGVRQETPTGTE
jgi:hypothetical protein